MPAKINSRRIEELRPTQWNQARLQTLVTRGRGKKILVIGDVGVDRYLEGKVNRISPEAPVPIVQVEKQRLKLGLASNVADNIQALGGVPFLVGIVGKDRCAEDFRALLKASGIKSSHLIVDPTRTTALKERVVSEGQQLLRIDYESVHWIGKETEKRVLNQVRAVMPYVDGVVIEDYAKGMLTESLVQAIFDLARKKDRMVAVDPNLKTPSSFYRGATLLTPNMKEAEYLSGITISDQESLLEAGFEILRSTQTKYVIITRGKDGMALFSRGKKTVRLIPTFAQEVYDVSGAGDTVISVLILSLASGGGLEEAAVLGNLAAGVEVGKRGTATVSPQEIHGAMNRWFSSQHFFANV